MKKRNITRWYDSEPKGTPEELKEAFETVSNYTYKLLSYSDKDEAIPKEVLDKERRIFTFAKQGPRAGYYLLNPRGKLCSADVLYILTSSVPASHLAKSYGLAECKIREIRRGESKDWAWEYAFVSRMKGIVKNYLVRHDPATARKNIYSLSHVHSPTNIEILYYLSSYRKAVKLREDILTKPIYNKLVKEGILDIIYPIEKIEVIK